jgi:hypothetical protein
MTNLSEPATSDALASNKGFAMRRLFRRSAVSETEKVRGGGGPLDNLVVLIVSLFLLAILGAALLWYFGYWPGGHPIITEHG